VLYSMIAVTLWHSSRGLQRHYPRNGSCRWARQSPHTLFIWDQTLASYSVSISHWIFPRPIYSVRCSRIFSVLQNPKVHFRVHNILPLEAVLRHESRPYLNAPISLRVILILSRTSPFSPQ
jgi:hypothetical protein